MKNKSKEGFLLFAIILCVGAYVFNGCHKSHQHVFSVNKGVVIADTSKIDSTVVPLLKSPKVSRGIYNGKSVYFVNTRKYSKRLGDTSIYVMLVEKVRVAAKNLGNEKDELVDFVSLYDAIEVTKLDTKKKNTNNTNNKQANTTEARLNCSTTGMHVCYNTQGIGPVSGDIIQIVDNKLYPMYTAFVHNPDNHNNLYAELQYVKIPDSLYGEFVEKLTSAQCVNLLFDKLPETMTLPNSTIIKYHEYANTRVQ